MRVVLHIGLPKTATTTIQHTLWLARDVLAERGVTYPGPYVGHHALSKNLDLVALGKLRGLARVEALLQGFAAEAERDQSRQLLISSEALFSLRPAAVELLAAQIRAHLPRTEAIVVVAYVREPIGFAASIGQQAVKSGRMRLSELFENPYPLEVIKCLTIFTEVFGQQNMVVRQFDPPLMKDGDVIADFLDATGVGDLDLARETPVLNSALSWEGLQVADALAALRPRAKRNATKRGIYKRVLEGIGGAKFVLPDEVQERVIEQSRGDLTGLREMFGLDIVPKRVAAPALTFMPEATVLSVAQMVERLVEGD